MIKLTVGKFTVVHYQLANGNLFYEMITYQSYQSEYDTFFLMLFRFSQAACHHLGKGGQCGHSLQLGHHVSKQFHWQLRSV